VAASNVSTTSASTQIPSGWINDVIKAARFKMVLPKTVNMDIKWDKKLGQTIHQRRTPNWEKATKFPNTNITATAYDEPGDEILYIDTFEYSAAQVEWTAELFLDEVILKEMADSQAYVLNRGVESTLANRFQNISTTVPGTALGTELTWQALTLANQALLTAGVDVDAGGVTFAMSPQQMTVFKQNNLFMDSNLAGDEATDNLKRSTLVQKQILGAQVIWSNLLRAPGTGGHDMAMYARDAFYLVYAQKPKPFFQARALAMANMQGLWQAYGTKASFRHPETPGSLSLSDAWAVYLPGL
jgi:hypothetical protein